MYVYIYSIGNLYLPSACLSIQVYYFKEKRVCRLSLGAIIFYAIIVHRCDDNLLDQASFRKGYSTTYCGSARLLEK